MQYADVGRLPAYARQVLSSLSSAGYTAYYAGGCVRDLLLGLPPGDVDIASSARPEEVEALFPHTCPTGKVHGTVTVLWKEGAVEVTTFRGEGTYSDRRHPDRVTYGALPEEDAKRRDFTVNALFADGEGQVYDYVGGLEDLQAGILRAVGDAELRFSEDALRMLRALRFRAKLGFSLEPKTEVAIRNCADLIGHVAAERVCEEVRKTLATDRPEAVSEMLGLGLLPGLGPAAELPKSATCALRRGMAVERLALFCAVLVREGRICAPDQFATALKCDRRTAMLAADILRAAEVYGTDARSAREMLRCGGETAAMCAAALFSDAETARREIAGVLSRGECVSLEMLALRGGDVAALCPDRSKTGAILQRLLDWVVEHPEENRREDLLMLAKTYIREAENE